MRSKNEKGFTFYLFLLAIVVIIGGVAWWKTSQNNQRKAQAIAAQQKLEADQHAEEKRKEIQALAEKEQLALKAQTDRESSKKAIENGMNTLTDLYGRWNDAYRLANNTSRIALAGQVSVLQSLKREAESTVLPECFGDSKKKMVSGMSEVIEGFVQFMADPNMGKILAQIQFEKGNLLLSEYETAAKACAAE